MTQEFSFFPQGVCSSEFQFKITDGKIENLTVIGGCDGNLKGISNLVRGMKVEDVIERLNSIDCEGQGTSCPDQISKALVEYLKQQS